MKTATKTLPILLVLGLAVSGITPVMAKSAAKHKRPLVQMAILLDTSSSMNGLINQARSQLWKVVNEFVASKKDGQRPDIQVALFEYGKSSLAKKGGYIRLISGLTTDLDKISEELFALRTNGGDEYCGQVIDEATRRLEWSPDRGAFRVIFIAGNEPFTQGPVDFRRACKAAIEKGITVNTIHCGSEQAGVSGKWKDGALLADGTFMNIDQNRKVRHIAAPQDGKIARLGAEINRTYVPYGAAGREGVARQEAQDMNARSSAGGSMMNRAVFKSSANYRNTDWDLVDAVDDGRVKLAEVEEKALPEDMRKMSPAERKAHLETQKKKRAGLQEKIRVLNAERRKYVAEKRREMSDKGGDTLDAAMIKSVRTQASKKNFKFEN